MVIGGWNMIILEKWMWISAKKVNQVLGLP